MVGLGSIMPLSWSRDFGQNQTASGSDGRSGRDSSFHAIGCPCSFDARASPLATATAVPPLCVGMFLHIQTTRWANISFFCDTLRLVGYVSDMEPDISSHVLNKRDLLSADENVFVVASLSEVLEICTLHLWLGSFSKAWFSQIA
jgi:hypothetical protein